MATGMAGDAGRAADDERWMRRALVLAARVRDREDEVPVGAVIVRDGVKIAEGMNLNIPATIPPRTRRWSRGAAPGAASATTGSPAARCT